MKITYIYHSSFLIEFESCYMLFDYFKGNIPFINKNKPIYIFSSHSHSDHFNKIILEIFKNFNSKYILSRDIFKKYKIENENITYVYGNREYEIDNIKIKTLKSTDLGVAYIVECENKTIFHSGDLHFWVWQEETKQYNNNMEANYKREIEKLKDTNIDIAFIPLDPRQGSWYYKGMEYILSNVKIKNVFPMHSMENYDLIDKFINSDHYNNRYNSKIYKLTEDKTYEL